MGDGVAFTAAEVVMSNSIRVCIGTSAVVVGVVGVDGDSN